MHFAAFKKLQNAKCVCNINYCAFRIFYFTFNHQSNNAFYSNSHNTIYLKLVRMRIRIHTFQFRLIILMVDYFVLGSSRLGQNGDGHLRHHFKSNQR